jgi:CubicO group peptidase (beta-lactamase class C family)
VEQIIYQGQHNMRCNLFLAIFALLTSSLVAGDFKDISSELEQFLKKASVPGIAAAVVVDGKLLGAGAVGVRKQGSPEKVLVTDKFHHGSNTKSMTAVLAAMLVDEGLITWETTVSRSFPDLDIHPDFQRATLRQLLTNTGGAPPNVGSELWNKLWLNEGTAEEQRMTLVKGVLSQPPAYKPGNQFVYSNVGFTIAGVMLERVAKTPYEELLTNRLFKPLGMESAGFRAPATLGKVDQPYGHAFSAGKLNPVDPEPRGDNPRGIAPAAAVHCSILDFAKYAQFHLGTLGADLLSEKNREVLYQKTTQQSYAMGWGVGETSNRDRSLKTKLYTHDGSNTMFYSRIWLIPHRKAAVMVTFNAANPDAAKSINDVVMKLVRTYVPMMM